MTCARQCRHYLQNYPVTQVCLKSAHRNNMEVQRNTESVLNLNGDATYKRYLCVSDFILLNFESLNRLPVWNSQKCSIFPLVFVAGYLQGHWWSFISRNYVVWPNFFLMNVFIALKGTHFLFLNWKTRLQHVNYVRCNERPKSEIFKYRNYRTNSVVVSKKISNDQELIQSDPTSCPQNQKGNN